MYSSIADILEIAETRAVPIWRVVLENEMALTGLDEAGVFSLLEARYLVMCESAQRTLTHPLQESLIQASAQKQFLYSKGGNALCGEAINRAMARALSCSEANAGMSKICAAPTAGSCGILPAVLITVGELRELEQRTILEGLLTASGLGTVVVRNATISGAEAGCQAECGVAAAIAAAAAVQLSGGDDLSIVSAFSLALMNCLGLVCDPIAGLVQVPCAQRNASQTVNALLSADMAMAGMRSPIPADEMIGAMYSVGRLLPAQLRETALGGIANTPAGIKIAKSLKPAAS